MARPHEGLSGEDLAGQLESAYNDRTRLEEQRVAIKAEQVTNAELIAKLEAEDIERRKAGFVTAEIGAGQG